MKPYPITFIVGAMLAASATALAQSSPAAEQQTQEQHIQKLFQELDSNRDGVLDASEARADRGLNNAFPRLATDGKLSESRFIEWYKKYDQAPAQE